MRIIEIEPGVVSFGQIEQRINRCNVAVHAEHQVGDNHFFLRGASFQLAFELRQIAMTKPGESRAGKLGRIDQRSMVELVGEHLAVPITQRGQHTQVGHVAGGKKQGSRLANEVCERGFEVVMKAVMAGDEVRGSRADAALVERGVRGPNQRRIGGQAQIIVAAKRDDALAVDRDVGALRAVEQQAPAFEVIRFQRRQPQLQTGQRGQTHDNAVLTGPSGQGC